MSESAERVHVYLRSANLTENARIVEREGGPFLVLAAPPPVRAKLRVVDASGNERGFEVLRVVEVAEGDKLAGVGGRWIDVPTERVVGSEHLEPDPDAVAAAQSGDFGASSSGSGPIVVGSGESGTWRSAEVSGTYRREPSGSFAPPREGSGPREAAAREDSGPREAAPVGAPAPVVLDQEESSPIDTNAGQEGGDAGGDASGSGEGAGQGGAGDDSGRGKKRKGRSRG
jgi:hypothetical protein